MTSPRVEPDDHILQDAVREILTLESRKILKMLSDLADVRAFTREPQRSRLEDIEETLRLALLEVQRELRRDERSSPLH